MTFHHEDNGVCVLRVNARGQRDHGVTILANKFVQASGDRTNDRIRGMQFHVRFSKAMPPATGIEYHLGSGMVRGIGPVYGRKLVLAFRSQVFNVIQAEPHRLQEVAGIGPKRYSDPRSVVELASNR